MCSGSDLPAGVRVRLTLGYCFCVLDIHIVLKAPFVYNNLRVIFFLCNSVVDLLFLYEHVY